MAVNEVADATRASVKQPIRTMAESRHRDGIANRSSQCGDVVAKII
ncbi:hypothetical protein RE6C_04777 [Rhodopirellula europaea 6C]|uniref:Uncharacterized protein n=1 Tax=Rhodopirellula europaea 6C TaxID=1263867 RepID=M2AC17_9BACT|nr:hypothetical protein RE6C_04777 [Rhodopirellula europaea 6C]